MLVKELARRDVRWKSKTLMRCRITSITGRSDVNEAMITGESRPLSKEPGAQVIGGTINGDPSASSGHALRVRVTATGDETALAGIMRLVEQAQQSKSDTQILADKAAGWLFYIALVVAAITAVAWIVSVGFELEALERVVTVLVIACPHALGLAVPLVVAISTSMGASSGISNSRFSIIVTWYSFVVATSVAGYAARTTKVVTPSSLTRPAR
jgi:P-type E1-E2 ATPase